MGWFGSTWAGGKIGTHMQHVFSSNLLILVAITELQLLQEIKLKQEDEAIISKGDKCI